jgi:apolipoprotein N-acyltransferase
MTTPQGFRRNLTAMFFGALGVLTLPPFFFLPLAVIAYGGLFWLLSAAKTRRRAFWDGFFWGWGYFMAGLYWFTIALLTEPEKFAWLIPFALFGLTAVIALYIAITAALFYQIRGRGIISVLLFSILWTLIEFARGHLFTGFPWNLAGYALMADDGLMQLASLVGVYGMSWLVVIASVLPVAIMMKLPHAKKTTAALSIVLAAAAIWGHGRIAAAGDAKLHDGVMLRLVQANIAQHHKWDPKLQFEGLRRHVALSQSEGVEKVTHIIWPETAVPYVIRPDTTLTTRIGQMLRPGQQLITGGLHAEGDNIYNSIASINHEGKITSRYDKHKLVPFGEFLPLRWLIPDGLETPVGMKDFSRGAGPQTLSWQGLPPVSPLICYEAIFPELAVGETRPEFLLNLTNDAWFGLSTGPHQHFHMARLRAVEQGLPLVRVANTGISAVVDGYGRILSYLELGSEGVLDAGLPKAEATPTFYHENPNLVVYFLLLIIILLHIYQRNNKIVN